MNNSILKRIVVAMLMISALFFSINPLSFRIVQLVFLWFIVRVVLPISKHEL